MSKTKVNMTNWQLRIYEDRYNLSGYADDHPNLGKDDYVATTSELVDYTFEDDVLTYITLNTKYICPLKYMSPKPYSNLILEGKEKMTHQADDSDDILDKIIAASAKLALGLPEDEMLARIKELQEQGQAEIKEMEQKKNDLLINIAKQYEDCVYIEVSSVPEGSKLAYHLGEYTGVIYPHVHVGMFQDSVLYMKYATEEDPASLDFRYFPHGWNDMETYSWSDNIKNAVIKNETKGVLRFNDRKIAPGDTVLFGTEGHVQQLISPDCYNGKSLFSGKKDD